MQLIRCTGKLIKELGLRSKDLTHEEPPFSFLGQWHANLLHVNHQKTLLFVNDRTLFNFVIPGLTRAQVRDLPNQFRQWLSCVVAAENLPSTTQDKILVEYEDIRIGKSSDRSVLGSSNDIAFHYKLRILNAGGIHSSRVPEIIRDLNRMPMQAIPTKFPIDELRKLYNVPTQRVGRGSH